MYLFISQRVLHTVGILLQAIPGIDLLLLCIILGLVLLGIVDHAVDVLLAQPALLICDGDLLLLACKNEHRSVSVLASTCKVIMQTQSSEEVHIPMQRKL